jgi:dienelactone hydrolase
MENQIVIVSSDGTFRAYIARPKALPAPAVVVLQELFGVNDDIRKTCDELAEQGFIAVAPRPLLASGAGRRPQRHFRARLAAWPPPLSGL